MLTQISQESSRRETTRSKCPGSQRLTRPPITPKAQPLAQGERRALAAWVPKRACVGALVPAKVANSTAFDHLGESALGSRLRQIVAEGAAAVESAALPADGDGDGAGVSGWGALLGRLRHLRLSAADEYAPNLQPETCNLQPYVFRLQPCASKPTTTAMP